MQHPTMVMLSTLAIGTIVLMFGILVSKEPDQSLACTLRSSLAWGAGFFLSMCVQVLVLAAL